MDVKEAIQKRRSIRRFTSDPVSDELIVQLLESARLAPSGSNTQPWRFIVVRDAETRKKLQSARIINGMSGKRRSLLPVAQT